MKPRNKREVIATARRRRAMQSSAPPSIPSSIEAPGTANNRSEQQHLSSSVADGSKRDGNAWVVLSSASGHSSSAPESKSISDKNVEKRGTEKEHPAVTPARKAKASLAFSTAAAVASSRRGESHGGVSNRVKLDDSRELDEVGTAGSSINSPLVTIRGILKSIPAHLSAADVGDSPSDASYSSHSHLTPPKGGRGAAIEVGQKNADALTIKCGPSYLVSLQHTSKLIKKGVKRPIWRNNTLTVVVTNNDPNNDIYYAKMTGAGISQDAELIYLQHVNRKSCSTENQFIKYGDVVSIHAPLAHGKALGVRSPTSPSSSKGGNGSVTQEVGFYRSLWGQAELWIIRAPPLQLTRDHVEQEVNLGGFVQSTQGIILQNQLTGGVLSVESSGSLTLHSCLEGVQEGWNSNSSTPGPTEKELFQLVLAYVPPLPNWSTAHQGNRRPYLDGTHLFYPRRNENFSRKIQHRGMASTTQSGGAPLQEQPVEIQELMMVEEVISCLMGLEGMHLCAKKVENATSSGIELIEYTIPDGLDQSLANLLLKILPTCSAYVKINSFLSQRQVQYEFGSVSQALCGAMDDLIQEYLELLIVLEDAFRTNDKEGVSSVSMTSLWLELEPSIRTMSILSHVVDVVTPLKGGELLNRLDEVMSLEYIGDDRARSLFSYLLDNASVPYMVMLRGWLEGGIVKDPYDEFMVKESKGGHEEGWDAWYMIRDEHVLNVMRRRNDTSLATMVLTTGKYWNAIMLCDHRDKRAVQLPKTSKDDKCKSDTTLTYGMGTVQMSRYIEGEYKAASKTFLNILLRDYRVLDVLAFMKRYFLLDQGDFFVHFLDMAEDELLQEMSNVSRGRVQNWMSLSIQMSGGGNGGDFERSVAVNDTPKIGTPNRPLQDILSSLKGEFATQSLVNHLDALHVNFGGIDSNEPKTPSRHIYGGANKGLTGVEAFMLDFHQISFPLSLPLSRHTVTNYQLLFRHLFFVKHVERRLVGTWLDLQTIKEFQSLRKDLGRTYCLRQRMLHFMQNFVYYMMFEVIEPNWLEMESKILQREHKEDKKYGWTSGRVKEGQQRTVDDVLIIHNDFVRRTLQECLLTNRDLIRTLTKLMTTCLLFSDQMKLFMESTQIDEEQIKIATEQRQRRSRQALQAAIEKRRVRKQKQIDRLQRELRTESYNRMIGRFEQVFHSNLSEFMSQLMSNSDGCYHTHLANLCIRLDYNGYVTRSMKSETKF